MKTIKLKCSYIKCGIEFEKKLAEYNRCNKKGKRHFCSKSCAAAVSSIETSLKNRSEIIKNGKKVCGSCKLPKSLEEFNKKGNWYSDKCKDCNKKNWKIWYSNNKQRHINKTRLREKDNIEKYKEFKTNLKCSFCSENESCCLSFHHKDGKIKDFNLSEKTKYFSTPKFEKELKKCICVCHNCHSKIHNGILKIVENMGFEPICISACKADGHP